MSDFDDVGFDPIDTELTARLGDAAPEPGDADAALAALRPRFVHARRRRRAGFLTVGAATLALLVGVALALGSTTPNHSVKVPPANRSTPAPTTDRTTVTPPDPVTHTTVAPDDDAGATVHSGTGDTDDTDASVTPLPTVDDHGAGESIDSESSHSESSDSESSDPESSSSESHG